MSLNPMPVDRHEHLVKCAEQVIGLMNAGTDPDAALLKVARDGQLTSHEIDRVSHAVNNSKTVAVLRSEKGEDRAKPFTLTNADKVKTHLFDESPFAGTTNGGKKQASASYVDNGTYTDAEPEDHAKVAAEVFGKDDQVQTHQKIAFDIDDGLKVTLVTEGTGRLIDNPFQKLGHLKHRIDEASLEGTRRRDAAITGLEKLSEEFRRVDAPNFRDVEKLAAYLGCSDETLNLIFDGCELERFGHRRAGGEKLAGVAVATPRAHELAKLALHVEKNWREAADYNAVRDRLQESYQAIETKLAGDGSAIAKEIESLPGQLTGAGTDTKAPVSLIGSALGTFSEKGPDVEMADKSPLGVGQRQQLANADTRGALDDVLSDPYVNSHPIQDVVDAFNRLKSVNPSLSGAELGSLVRQALAQDGQLPPDLLARVRGK